MDSSSFRSTMSGATPHAKTETVWHGSVYHPHLAQDGLSIINLSSYTLRRKRKFWLLAGFCHDTHMDNKFALVKHIHLFARKLLLWIMYEKFKPTEDANGKLRNLINNHIWKKTLELWRNCNCCWRNLKYKILIHWYFGPREPTQAGWFQDRTDYWMQEQIFPISSVTK